MTQPKIITGDIKTQTVPTILINAQGNDIATGKKIISGSPKDILSQVRIVIAIDENGNQI